MATDHTPPLKARTLTLTSLLLMSTVSFTLGLYAEQARTDKVDLRGLSLYLRQFCVRELRQGLLNLADRIQAKSLRRLYLLLKRIGAWQQRSGDR
jgi:hypothetical protein